MSFNIFSPQSVNILVLVRRAVVASRGVRGMGSLLDSVVVAATASVVLLLPEVVGAGVVVVGLVVFVVWGIVVVASVVVLSKKVRKHFVKCFYYG